MDPSAVGLDASQNKARANSMPGIRGAYYSDLRNRSHGMPCDRCSGERDAAAVDRSIDTLRFRVPSAISRSKLLFDVLCQRLFHAG